MEKFKELFENRVVRGGLLAMLGVFTLSACADGTVSAPTVEDIQKDGQYVEMTRPDGSGMTCLFYAARGSAGYSGYSWLVTDCDWGNAYDGGLATPSADDLSCQPASDGSFVCRPANG